MKSVMSIEKHNILWSIFKTATRCSNWNLQLNFRAGLCSRRFAGRKIKNTPRVAQGLVGQDFNKLLT